MCCQDHGLKLLQQDSLVAPLVVAPEHQPVLRRMDYFEAFSASITADLYATVHAPWQPAVEIQDLFGPRPFDSKPFLAEIARNLIGQL